MRSFKSKYVRGISSVLMAMITACGLLGNLTFETKADEGHRVGIAVDGSAVETDAGVLKTRVQVDVSYDGGLTAANPLPEYDYEIDPDNPVIEFDLDETQDLSQVRVIVTFTDLPTVNTNSLEIKTATLNWDDNQSIMANYDPLNPNTIWYQFPDADSTAGVNFLNIALGFPQQGDPGIVEESRNRIYAYPLDLSQPANNPDEIAQALATELYARYISVPMFGTFELPIADVCDSSQQADVQLGISELQGRINVDPSSTTMDIQCGDGSTATVDYVCCTVNWGLDERGNEITSIIPVISLQGIPNYDANSSYLLSTDFDNSQGMGHTYYVFTSDSTDDVVPTADSSSGAAVASDVLFTTAAACTNVVVGGNGVDVYPINDQGLFTCDVDTPSWYTLAPAFHSTLRILDTSSTYICLLEEGETADYQGLGLNGMRTDAVWNTGDDATAQVYIGNTTLYLEPLTYAGLSTKAITDIALADASQKDGVTLDKSNLNKVKITCESNFYDTIPLVITYEGGVKKTLTIERIGLVISYKYLGGNPNQDIGTSQDVLFYDSSQLADGFTYNYFSGEQIIVYATYYHPSQDATLSGGDDLYLNLVYDDGTSEIISHTDSAHGFDGYTEATGSAVATTSFIIGFMPAKEFDGTLWTNDITTQTFRNKNGNLGGFSATVLNAGFDDADSYGGTQVGSGSGVYWDGLIEWQY